MSTPQAVDAARLSLLLNELRLPAIKTVWPQFAEQADKEGSRPAAVASSSPVRRTRTRRTRPTPHRASLVEARLPPGKTLDSFDFEIRADASPRRR